MSIKDKSNVSRPSSPVEYTYTWWLGSPFPYQTPVVGGKPWFRGTFGNPNDTTTTPEQIAIRVYNDSILANCLNCGEPNCLKGLKFIDSQPILPHCYQGGSGRERFCDFPKIASIKFSSKF